VNKFDRFSFSFFISVKTSLRWVKMTAMKSLAQAHPVLILLPLGVAVFVNGITWGLPSRDADEFLFASVEPWSGDEILHLAGDRADDPNRGADVDIDPLVDRDRVVCLNETDAQRAAIVRRYRLYSYQPDEMITLMSLADMGRSGSFDPKLYQYGGLWIYPVGGLLRLASAIGAISLTPDLAYYLDRPEEFGKFYIVARLYCVAWAMIGIWVVYWLTRRLTGGCTISATLAAVCYIVMPVVVNMAHEAKPHLPGAVLMLLAVAAAMRYVETGRRRWWLSTAMLCGAAFGMVLSVLPIFIVLPVMELLRKQTWSARLKGTVLATLCGLAVYLVTNPYIVINLFINREVLRSNFGNSLAMYEMTRLVEGLFNAAWLVAEGASPVLAGAGLVGAGVCAVRGYRNKKEPRASARAATGSEQSRQGSHGLGWLLAAPAALIVVQFIALAAGKPGEYGRFAVLPDIALALAAVIAIRQVMTHPLLRLFLLFGLCTTSALSGYNYLAGFMRDCAWETSRMQAAGVLQKYCDHGATSLGIQAEPAPYGLPPVDLFCWRIVLLTENGQATTPIRPDVLIRPQSVRPFAVESDPESNEALPGPRSYQDTTPISWADKTFELFVFTQPKPATQP